MNKLMMIMLVNVAVLFICGVLEPTSTVIGSSTIVALTGNQTGTISEINPQNFSISSGIFMLLFSSVGLLALLVGGAGIIAGLIKGDTANLVIFQGITFFFASLIIADSYNIYSFVVNNIANGALESFKVVFLFFWIAWTLLTVFATLSWWKGLD